MTIPRLSSTLITALRVPEFDESRRQQSTTALDELVASIKLQGILEPILVRRPGSEPGEPSITEPWEILAGQRRLAAAKLAGFDEVPTIAIGPMTDTEAIEIRLIENLQREDVHPLDEAELYGLLIPPLLATDIARLVSKTPAYVHRRHALLNLAPAPRDAYREGSITVRHAERLARLTEKDQLRALHQCRRKRLAGVEPPYEPSALSELEYWLEQNTTVDPTDPVTAYYFPEFADALSEDEIDGAALIQLSDSMMPGADLQDKQHGLVGRRSWIEITKKKDRCDHTRRGVVVHGGRMRILDVCAKKACPKHRPVAKPPSTGGRASTAAKAPSTAEPAWMVANRKRQAEREAWEKARPGALKAFAAHVVAQPVDVALVTRVCEDGYRAQDIKRLVGPITEANLGQALAVNLILSSYDRQSFVRTAKVHGFKLPRPAKAAKKKASKKATKKAATKKKATKKKASKKATKKAATKKKATKKKATKKKAPRRTS